MKRQYSRGGKVLTRISVRTAAQRLLPILFGICALARVAHAAPSVAKVEPPGWWAGHSVNPVRIMITGQDLAGPVLSKSRYLLPRSVTFSENHHYAFFDLAIRPNTPAGAYELEIANTRFRFEILPRLPLHGRFAGFSTDDVWYLLMPDRFANGDTSNDGALTDRSRARMYHGGDFAGITQRLGYLKELGVTAIWMTPVYDNSNRAEETNEGPATSYHGYGAVDLYRVEEQFGDLASFRSMVEAAHRVGIKVIQDQVANHVGPEHSWAVDPPTPTWFHGTRASHLRSSSEMWTLVDPYRSPGLSRRMLEGWFVDRLPDLNQDDREVERYLIQNTLYWIGVSGIDGIRQDTVGYVAKRFWRKWMQAIKREHPRFEVVGEVYSRDPTVVAHFEDTGMRLFDFPLQEALTSVFIGGGDLADVPAVLARDGAYEHPQRLITFVGSHDVRRFREKGSHESLKSAFQVLFTTRGSPLIYYGDEIGMQGGGDPDNRRDFPGGWQGDARSAFTREGRTREEEDMFTHVQTLARIRARYPALRRGRLTTLDATDETYIYTRTLAGHEPVVIGIGKGARFEIERAPWLAGAAELRDSLGSSAVLRATGRTVEITGPGIFVAPRRGAPRRTIE